MRSPQIRSPKRPRTSLWPRAFLAALVLCAGAPVAHAWEVDFHYYVIYLLLRARGYSTEDSNQLAGFSQYIDDNAFTEPMFQFPPKRGKYHFDGSGPEKATERMGVDGATQIADAFKKFRANPTTGKFHVGVVLHRLADTFSHAGFTAWRNKLINRREGSWRPYIGHADAPEKGHQPDLPHLNQQAALAAAEWLHLAIPDGDGPKVSWSALKNDLDDTFGSLKTREERVKRVQQLIEKHTNDKNVNYDEEKFAEQSDEFQKELRL